MSGFPRRRLVVAVLAMTLLVGVFFLGRELLVPPTEEERVRDLFGHWREANLEGDFGRLWDLMCVEAREDIRATLEEWRGRDPSDPEWIGLLERTGLGPEDIEGLDARGFYVASQEGGVRLHPAVYEEIRRKLGSIRIRKLEIESDRASLECDDAGREWISHWWIGFAREEGEWRTHQITELTMRFRRLERRLSAYLPPSKVEISQIRLVVEVGPARPDPDRVAMLERLIRAIDSPDRDRVVVLLDPSPHTPWQGVIDLVDAAILAEAFVLFATSGEEDHPGGLRVNGIPLREFADVSEHPVPPDHPALSRILGLSR
jgi:hypothetical protein